MNLWVERHLIGAVNTGEIRDISTPSSQCLSPSLVARCSKIKKCTSQKEYRRDNKGEAFIDNDPLFSAAAKCTSDLAEAFADEHPIALKASELA